MNWKVRYVDYPEQFFNMETEIMATLRHVLSRGDLILREQTERFEEDLARFCGARYAVGVSNCTDALHLAYRAAGIGPGDEVITVSHTFVATVEMIVHLGAEPLLVDIGDDHNIDGAKIEAAITPRTKAIVPVSLNGRCADLERISRIADKYGLAVIEDSAQALGASCDGRKAGTFGLAGCFSFYPAKLLGAYGDAGAVVTNDAQLAAKIRLLRNHGRAPSGEISCWAFNCRIDNIQAALLDLKLARLPQWLERRREIARIYDQHLRDVPGLMLPPGPDADTTRYDVFQNYEIETDGLAGLTKHLKASGIEHLRPWGGKGVHQFPALGLGRFHLPRTERLFQRAVMLPMYPELSDEDARYVADVVRQFHIARAERQRAAA
ncbi:MAG: DegT/DnrJ/EryC1/StrS family aminotransferase [Planctomycetaceae bacterium]